MIKYIIVFSFCTITYFVFGYGVSSYLQGGILGQNDFIGLSYNSIDYFNFIFNTSMCAMMSTIANNAIVERVHVTTYIFFSIVTSAFIYSFGLGWVWGDGWLQELGFIDQGAASFVHVMGGLSGFVGTLLIGPRLGKYEKINKLIYINDDLILNNKKAN